ncbi:Cytochrome c [Pseudarcicella hirudinis]|uniref:Cytochrome c n=1 Tax=Pseudarcicella hirudinis TaxID=1079859 RepID=A0A1I5RCY2_9BACT|nr:cytochrome c [Pseudarcicella hirudinis]SFP56393.1 Cytochrome c [Pseudarcicella hirudinis]
MKNRSINQLSKAILAILGLMCLGFSIVIIILLTPGEQFIQEPNYSFYCGVQSETEPHTDITQISVLEQRGMILFKESCAPCHQCSSEALVGPGLKGISSRKSFRWIVNWIQNPSKVLKKRDKYALKLFENFNRAEMPAFPNYKKEDIKAILAYIELYP